jgi:hypothetical protein
LKKKKGEILFNVGDNINIKKTTVGKPKLSDELNASVIDADKNMVKILSSIENPNGNDLRINRKNELLI